MNDPSTPPLLGTLRRAARPAFDPLWHFINILVYVAMCSDSPRGRIGAVILLVSLVKALMPVIRLALLAAHFMSSVVQFVPEFIWMVFIVYELAERYLGAGG